MSRDSAGLRAARRGRGTAVALACAALLALVTPPAARAWEYPLLPHVQGLAFFPERMNDQDSSSFLLSAYYPHECWQLLDARLVDLEHVTLRIAPATGCTDTVSSWSKGFGLGVLAAGIHQLTVHATVHLPSRDTLVEEITVPYEVVHGAPGPPPPPPPPVDTSGSVLTSVEVTPPQPTVGDSITVRLRGRYPFPCGFISQADMPDTSNLDLVLSQASSCGDTTRAWAHEFVMGTLSRGNHAVRLEIMVVAGSSDPVVHDYPISISINDPNGPPPPPPPPVGGDWEGALLLASDFTPGAPLLGEPVSVSLGGRYPFACGAVNDAQVLGPDHLAVTLGELSSCTDTSRTWAHTFALGTPSVGEHWVTVDFRVDWADSVSNRHRFLRYTVTDPNAPPPPPSPPPGDSLAAGLSASHPNPFTVQTTFAVSLADPTVADVAVYDLGGRLVATLHHGVLPRGTSVLAWNGHRADGSRAPGGIYFYRLVLPHRVVNRRVVLLGTP